MTEPKHDERDEHDERDDARPPERAHPSARQLTIAVALLLATCASTTFVGSLGAGGSLLSGLAYSVPLMAILLAHELGHYIAARIHRVPASPPFFVPMPIPPLGTMGAVILMRGRIRSRDALLDIGAAGPLAGMAVALPVLAYGIAHSPVQPMQAGSYLQEGHSILYVLMLRVLKGPIPDGHDIMLSPTAFAGWVGLLVTMINLIPARQLDGGHVACALLGERFDRLSRTLRRLLLPLGIGVGLWYGLPAFRAGADATEAFGPGIQWLVWWLLLNLLGSSDGREHPQPDPGLLSPARRGVALGTLLLFVLLFMPAWLRMVHGAPTP
jgi:membrane-associated protease RseP (regulator of RpoE activity)